LFNIYIERKGEYYAKYNDSITRNFIKEYQSLVSDSTQKNEEYGFSNNKGILLKKGNEVHERSNAQSLPVENDHEIGVQEKGSPLNNLKELSLKKNIVGNDSDQKRDETANDENAEKKEHDIVYIEESNYSRIEYLISQGKIKLAEETLNQSLSDLEEGQTDLDLMFLKAYLQFYKGHLDVCIDILEDITSLDPHHISSVELLATVLYKKLGSMASVKLKHLYNKFPDSEIISLTFAQALIDNNKINDAINVLGKSYALNNSPDVAFNLSFLFLKKKDAILSEYYLREAIKHSSQQTASFSQEDIDMLANDILKIKEKNN